ncbi:NUDIX domain-containing protein [Paenibacillus sp. alder61]|uniref:NUDIX hydrolase n=1 Tax=Paenibacillus sp. alder61 TaxID=2862948 RepID=UPI001CD64A45|nr:NUDIX domain-containing protein [Paenibacillus sp. alder61]MCA1295459.1 NUDIX domain-containing protein [Paenibacillus sp. alder61]
MIKRLIKRLPSDLLVRLYTAMPFKGIKNWIVYKAQDKFLVAVLGVITNESGQVLLLNHVYREEPWGIPGGWMELEAPEKGLKREIQEETGLSVEITGIYRAVYQTDPDRVELIFRGEVRGGTFRPCAEISDILYCEVGSWPAGLPDTQKSLIQEVLEKTSV